MRGAGFWNGSGGISESMAVPIKQAAEGIVKVQCVKLAPAQAAWWPQARSEGVQPFADKLSFTPRSTYSSLIPAMIICFDFGPISRPR